MKRWLKSARAELIRDFTLALRYPVEFFFGIFILYVLFLGMFIGAKQLAGNNALAGSLDGIVIGFCMWFFALISINSMSVDIENEARQGTLEQVYLNAASFLGLLWVRGLVKIGLGAGSVVLLSILLQLTTGKYLNLSAAKILPLVLIVTLTVTGLAGFGLVLGALSLVFKRIGQLSAVVQFSLLFPAYIDLSQLDSPWGDLLVHLPLARGVQMLKALLAEGASGVMDPAALAWLLADTLAYVLLGSLVFAAMDRVARRGGMLAHY